MASVKFTDNYAITKANASVNYIDLGFEKAKDLKNDTTTTSAVSGSSTKATVHYNNNNPPPMVFEVSQQQNFPSGAHVTITGRHSNE